MLISELSPNFQEDTLDVLIEGKASLNESVLRITVKDLTGKINIIIQGTELVKAFEKLSLDTKLSLSYFDVSDKFEALGSYFPNFIPLKTTILHGSNSNYFVHITNASLPVIHLTHFNQTYSIFPDTEIGTIDLSKLYTLPDVTPQRIVGPNQEKFSNLKFIKDFINDSETHVSSCYAFIVDSSYPYQFSESSDFLSTLKITDPSIFPSTVNISIFTKTAQEMSKVAGYGDIVRLEQFSFKLHKGHLSGRNSFSTKQSKFHLFSLVEDTQIPYGSFRGLFSNIPEHYAALQTFRFWAKQNLSNRLPVGVNISKPLSQVQAREECDLLARVYEICKLGINDDDPSVIICYDRNDFSQIVIPKDKEKMIKWVFHGDIIRVKDAIHENGRICLSKYSDILKIHEAISQLYIPKETGKLQELSNLSKTYIHLNKTSRRAEASNSLKSMPIVELSQLSNIQTDEKCRIQAYAVHVSSSRHDKMYCQSCCMYLSSDICLCGNSTILNSDLTLYLWDGHSNDFTIPAFLPKESILNFLSNLSYQEFFSQVISSNSLLELGLLSTINGYEIIESSIK